MTEPAAARAAASRSPASAAPPRAAGSDARLAGERVERDLHRLEAAGAERSLELVERRRRVVRDADPADAALVALELEPVQVLAPRDEVVHLLDVDAAAVPLELPVVLLPALGDRARSRSSSRPSSRRGGRRAPRPATRSASPYIGDESNRRMPASSAASTTRGRARCRRGTSSTSRARPPGRACARSPGEAPREPARRERGREERRVVVRAATHVRQRQPLAGLAPALAVLPSATARLAAPGSRTACACGARRRGGGRARPPPRRAPRRSADRRARARRVRGLRRGEPAVAEPRAGADDPGPIAQTRRRTRRRAPRRAPRRPRRTPRRPSTHGADGDRRLDQARAPSSTRNVSESETGSAPPGTWTYATRSPASAAHTGATWLCSEQQTTGIPSSDSAQPVVLLGVAHRAPAATCTAASSRARPAPAARSRPRVRFACSTSKPPEPSPSSRAWTFTTTSSPSSTGPVSRGIGDARRRRRPRSRTSPRAARRTAVTRPRRRLSGTRRVERARA